MLLSHCFIFFLSHTAFVFCRRMVVQHNFPGTIWTGFLCGLRDDLLIDYTLRYAIYAWMCVS